MNKLTEYLKGAIEEMKKVTWPTKKETQNYTMMVIGISIGMAIFLGVLDFAFSKGIEMIITRR